LGVGGLLMRYRIGAMSRVRHAMFKIVMARVCAIAFGHEDDRLRHDLLMKVAVGRRPQSGAGLASQSTISRLENAPRKMEAGRLPAALIDRFGTTIKSCMPALCTSAPEAERQLVDWE
jgi:hypothetical protein